MTAKTAKRLLGRTHRFLARFALCARASIYLRNQAMCIINYHLGDISNPQNDGELALIKALGEHCSAFIDVGANVVKVFEGALTLLTGDASPLVIFEFCDWAETRVPDAHLGSAQEFLLKYHYTLWRLPDFLRGRKPLREPLTAGYGMLVASRR